MNDEQYKQAKTLKSEIMDTKAALESLSDERNFLELPQEIYDRHLAEKRAFLVGELKRLEAAFAAI